MQAPGWFVSGNPLLAPASRDGGGVNLHASSSHICSDDRTDRKRISPKNPRPSRITSGDHLPLMPASTPRNGSACRGLPAQVIVAPMRLGQTLLSGSAARASETARSRLQAADLARSAPCGSRPRMATDGCGEILPAPTGSRRFSAGRKWRRREPAPGRNLLNRKDFGR